MENDVVDTQRKAYLNEENDGDSHASQIPPKLFCYTAGEPASTTLPKWKKRKPNQFMWENTTEQLMQLTFKAELQRRKRKDSSTSRHAPGNPQTLQVWKMFL